MKSRTRTHCFQDARTINAKNARILEEHVHAQDRIIRSNQCRELYYNGVLFALSRRESTSQRTARQSYF